VPPSRNASVGAVLGAAGVRRRRRDHGGGGGTDEHGGKRRSSSDGRTITDHPKVAALVARFIHDKPAIR